MKILYFGGQKSGKSLLAEKKALELAKNKPYYIATYDNSFGDESMRERIKRHKSQREDRFETIEETREISKVLKSGEVYLVDCLSMWILNCLEDSEFINSELEKLERSKADIIFVLNDVGSGVIPPEKLSRDFVDMSGVVGQRVASFCDEVYEVKLGLEVRLK